IMLTEKEQELLNDSYFENLNQSKNNEQKTLLQSQKKLHSLVDWLKLAIPMTYEEMIVKVLGLPLELFDEQEGKLPH
ncbi:hypothetical protein, partial [Salmonella enterica]|uniref:hypothetical protein n=1 Tax=Salmonella enterica TaxID=28901 RepID=UPI0020C474C1